MTNDRISAIRNRTDLGRPIPRIDVKYLLNRIEEAESKNMKLLKEVINLACESVEREKTLAKLEAEIEAVLKGEWM